MADTIDLSTVAIGTQCSFYMKLLTFDTMFQVCSSLMVLPCHGMSCMLLYCIWRRTDKLKLILYFCIFSLIVYAYVRFYCN